MLGIVSLTGTNLKKFGLILLFQSSVIRDCAHGRGNEQKHGHHGSSYCHGSNSYHAVEVWKSLFKNNNGKWLYKPLLCLIIFHSVHISDDDEEDAQNAMHYIGDDDGDEEKGNENDVEVDNVIDEEDVQFDVHFAGDDDDDEENGNGNGNDAYEEDDDYDNDGYDADNEDEDFFFIITGHDSGYESN